MKQKLFYLFGLLSVTALLIYSCRNDYLQEQQTQNETNNLQLRSQIISLSESKHKAKLLSEISEAKSILKKQNNKNALGKIVNYGDSVSIDTDKVIFIQYGAYHTYTFNIKRNNSAINAPVENLILSLEPDGTYKELLKTYNLTPQDWNDISIGNGIDLSGKTETIELAKGTYNNNLSAKFGGYDCHYVSQQVYVPCCHNIHGEGNIGLWHQCTCIGSGLPKMYTIEVLLCDEITESNPGGGNSTNPYDGGGEPTDSGTNPDAGTTYPNPVEEAQDELGGTPTLPNLEGSPNTDTPCEKIKAHFANEKFKAKFDTLTKPSIFNQMKEKAFVMKHPPLNLTGQIEPAFIPIDMPLCSTGDEDAIWPSSKDGITIIMHNHTNEDCEGNTPVKAPSPTDIKAFLNILLPQANTYTGSYLGAASLTTTSGGNYMLMYDGTNYPGSIDFDKLNILKLDYKQRFQLLYQRNDNVTQLDIERVFTKFLKEKINKPGLNVYRVTSTTATKLEYDPTSPNFVKETVCP